MKKCIACGMPMRSKEEFAMGDESKNYCIHCAKANGEMQSYQEKLKSMTTFIVKTQGLNEQVAEKVAKETMAKLPAWQNK